MHYERVRRHGTTDSLHRTTCSVKGCTGKHKTKGYCSKHIQRVDKYGAADQSVLVRNIGVGASPRERFWSKVDKTPGLGRDGDCWEWTGCSYLNGYGTVQCDKISTSSHRMAWIFTHGYSPELQLLHSCDNPKCVNPAHLREGTQKENIQDAKDRGRMAVGKRINKNAVDPDVVQRARILFAQGYSRQDVMAIENVTYRTARNIDTGRSYQWIP